MADSNHTRPIEIAARLEEWDGINPLTPLQAAYLWFSLEPHWSGRPPERVKAMASQLAERFGIPVHSYIDETLGEEVVPKLTRGKLKRHAQQRGEIPSFLLSPEQRRKADEEKRPLKAPTNPHGNTERNAAKREQVLGAAVSCLAQWPERCREKGGKVIATKLRELIDEKAGLFWPEVREPPLKPDTIEDLIRDWFKKTAG